MASYPSSAKSAPHASRHDVSSDWASPDWASADWREAASSPSLASPPLSFPRPTPTLTTPSDAARAEVVRSEVELARMIESEIIPRLMLAHRAEARTAPSGERVGVGVRTLDSFIRMSLARDAQALADFVDTLMEGGLPLEDVFTGLLIPTARRLGVGWEDDTISFADVTVALSRLHQVVRTLAWRVPAPAVAEGARAICLAVMPGSQHTFGLTVLEDGFRRAGWRTWLDPHARPGDAEDCVAAEWFDVFGLGLTCDMPIEPATALVARVRAASCNPDVFVMLGGRMFCEHPELALQAGADATACDTREALLIADKAVRARAFG